MGKLSQWVKECIEGCRSRGEISASNNGQVLIKKLAERFDAGGVVAYNDLKDRPFYSTVLTKVEAGQGIVYYKVSDAIPEILPATGKIWFANGAERAGSIDAIGPLYHILDMSVIICPEDDLSTEGLTFPERGIYFIYEPLIGVVHYIAGAAFDSSAAEPEITWDGNPEVVHQIDPKFIPAIESEPKVFYINDSIESNPLYHDPEYTTGVTTEELKQITLGRDTVMYNNNANPSLILGINGIGSAVFFAKDGSIANAYASDIAPI